MKLRDFFRKYGDFSDSFKGNKQNRWVAWIINICVYVLIAPITFFAIWAIIGIIMCL